MASLIGRGWGAIDRQPRKERELPSTNNYSVVYDDMICIREGIAKRHTINGNSIAYHLSVATIVGL